MSSSAVLQSGLSTTRDQFCITAEEDLRIETSCTLLKLMLCSKLTNLPLHCDHTAMNLYNKGELLIVNRIDNPKPNLFTSP